MRVDWLLWATALLLFACSGLVAPVAAATCNASPRLGSSFIEAYYPAD